MLKDKDLKELNNKFINLSLAGYKSSLSALVGLSFLDITIMRKFVKSAPFMTRQFKNFSFYLAFPYYSYLIIADIRLNQYNEFVYSLSNKYNFSQKDFTNCVKVL